MVREGIEPWPDGLQGRRVDQSSRLLAATTDITPSVLNIQAIWLLSINANLCLF